MGKPDANLDECLATSTAPPEVRRIAAELLPAFYSQLKHIAKRSRSRLGAGHTMQTTALVHEAYFAIGSIAGLRG